MNHSTEFQNIFGWVNRILVLCFTLTLLTACSSPPPPPPASPPIPTVSIDVPDAVLVGENFTFEVRFENTAASGSGAIGYGPYIELYLPAWGKDGNDANPTSPNLLLKCDGIRYVNAETVFDNPSSLSLTFDELSMPSIYLDASPPASPDDCPPSLPLSSFTHPYSAAGATVLPLASGSTGAGHQLVVIPLPFISFEPDQPEITIQITAHVSDFADVGVPLTIHARGGFRHGASPTGIAVIEMPASISSCSNSPGQGCSEGVTTPVVFDISKQYLGKENEIVAGPNFVGKYEVSVAIADGQTINSLQVTDSLPAHMRFVGSQVDVTMPGIASPTGGSSCSQGVDYTFIPPSPLSPSVSGGMWTVKFCAPLAGTTAAQDVTITFDFSIVENGLGANCNVKESINRVKAKGKWTPVDPRDQTVTVSDDFVADDPALDVKCMAIQKSMDIFVDNGASGLTPGDILEYTLDFQISDYRQIGSLIATDYLADGQSLFFPQGVAPTLTVTDKVDTIVSEPVVYKKFADAKMKCTIIDPETGAEKETIVGGTRISFNISGSMTSSTAVPFSQGVLTGGWVGGVSTTPATGTITFHTIIDDAFKKTQHGINQKPLVKEDPLCNFVRITGKEENAGSTGLPHKKGPPIGVWPTPQPITGPNDDSGVSAYLVGDTLKKSVYAVKRGVQYECGPAATNPIHSLCPEPSYPLDPLDEIEIRAGDVVTYRLEKVIPSGDADFLKITDWLPLPVFSVADPHANGSNAGMIFTNAPCVGTPNSGKVCFGPSTVPPLLAGYPGFSTISIANSLSFDYGSFNDTNNAAKTIDLLFSVTVSTDPFADGLELTNEVLEEEKNSFGYPFDQVAIAQVNLREPKLSIVKGVVATDNPSGQFAPAPEATIPLATFIGLSDNPSGNSCARFNAPIISAGQIDTNLTGMDANDLVTFAIAVENSGGAPAYQIVLKDILPVDAKGELSCFTPKFDANDICVTDGTGKLLDFAINYTPGQSDATIELTNELPSDDGSNPGSNIAVITFNGALMDNEKFSSGCCDNTAELMSYAAIQDGPNFITPSALKPSEKDEAQVCSGPKPYAKCITSTSEAHTVPQNASSPGGVVNGAIGEIIRYRLITTIPEGTTHDLNIQDNLPAGMTYLSDGTASMIFAANDPVTNQGGWLTDTGGPAEEMQCSTILEQGLIQTISPNGTWPTVFPGTIINNDNDVLNQEFAILEFNALVNNIPANFDGSPALSNTFKVDYKDAQGNPIFGGTSGLVDVNIVEPKLTINKTVTMGGSAIGSVLNYTIIVSNPSPPSNTAAFDVVVSDVLSSCLTDLNNVTFSTSNGVTNNSTSTALNVVIDKIPADDSITIKYQVTLSCASNQCPVENKAEVTWTSLPGPNGTTPNITGSTTPGASGAADGERNGSSLFPPNPANSPEPPNTYHASASVDICAEICVEKQNTDGTLLAGWDMEIRNGGSLAATLTTSSTSSVCTAVIAGDYTVIEPDMFGWTPVTPSNGQIDVTVQSGGTASATFINKEIPLPEAEHFKCYDVDDPFTKTVTLEDQFGKSQNELVRTKQLCTPVDKNNEGMKDDKRHLVCYELLNKPPVNRRVQIMNQFGMQEFIVQEEKLLCVPSWKHVVEEQICGTKFNDLNGDGIWNQNAIPPEPGIAGWQITVTGHGSVTTDIDGDYCITVPETGTYTVTEKDKVGWNQTFPTNSADHSVTVGIGETVNDINFGNKEQEAICFTPPVDMVSWWDADDVSVTTATDRWNGNHGMLSGGATIVSGQVGNAFDLNGSGQYVQIPDHPSLTISGDVTVDLWARRNSNKVTEVLIHKGAPIRSQAAGPSSYFMGIFVDDTPVAGFHDAAGNPHLINGPSPIIDGLWHHYTYVRNNTTHELFVDGVSVDAQSFSPSSPGDTTGFGVLIGAFRTGLGNIEAHFNGLIDEVEIFDRALSLAEIQGIVNVQGAGKCKSRICGFKFEDSDNSGTWDQANGEAGLADWDITVTDASGQDVGTSTTDANGRYCIHVPESTTPYTVAETPQTNWTQTFPVLGGAHTVQSVANGQAVNDINFGNRISNPSCCLSVQKVALNNSPSSPWPAGSQGQFTLEVTNICDYPIQMAQYHIRDELDSNFTFVSATSTSSQWNCSLNTPWLECVNPVTGILPAGNSLDLVTVTVDVGTNPVTMVENCAEPGLWRPAQPIDWCSGHCIGINVLPPFPPQSCVNPPLGMVSWWDADDTSATPATDRMGGNHGALIQNVGTVLGRVGNAFSLNGTNQYVQVPDHPSLTISGDVTVDLWAKRNSATSGPGMLIVKGVTEINNFTFPTSYFIGIGFDANNVSKPIAGFHVPNSNGTGIDYVHITSTAPPIDDLWHHYAYVRSGLTHELFVDGQSVASASFLNLPGSTAGQDLIIGAVLDGSNTPSIPIHPIAHFNGLIDEVEIFNRALSQTEIQGIFNAQAAGKCKSRICGFKFNDLNGANGWDQAKEPGLPGWDITVTDASGQPVGTSSTDADGRYCVDVPESTTPYIVQETPQANWTQTFPASGTHSVPTVTTGQTVDNINFGNQAQASAAPCCLVVQKTAVNNQTPWPVGTQGEFSLDIVNVCSQPVYISSSEAIAVKNEPNQNYFSLASVTPGTSWSCNIGICYYFGAVSIPPGPMGDPFTVQVNVLAQPPIGAANICTKTGIHIPGITAPWCASDCGQICGYKFDDVSGEGLWDQQSQIPEAALGGWNVSVTNSNAVVVGTATTDASTGRYCVTVAASSGPYSVTEDMQSQSGNWTQTAPTTPHNNITVAADQTVDHINFGNKLKTPPSPSCCVQVNKTQLGSPWQSGGQAMFTLEIENSCNMPITVPPNILHVLDNPLGTNLSFVSVAASSSWSCSTGYVGCMYTNAFTLLPGEKLTDIVSVTVDVGAQATGNISNCSKAGLITGAAANYCHTECNPLLIDTKKNLSQDTTSTKAPLVSLEKSHSPSRFSTGSKGSFSIKVTNKGKALTKGMLKVIDHLPVGLTVKSGEFRADLWSCKGGMVSSRGQDVTCIFNKRLRKNRWSTIKLNTSIAPEAEFPAGVNVVKNCATAYVQSAAGAVVEGPKACDKVRIRHVDSRGVSTLSVGIGKGVTILDETGSVSTISPDLSIEKKHSPSRFSTGSKGSFTIKVKNTGDELGKGMLTVVDYMPPGLAVKTGGFRAGSWMCKGEEVSERGQSVSCAYNKILGKKGRATLYLNAAVASEEKFPIDVNEVENCASASVQGAAGAVKVCDKVKIRHVKTTDVFNLFTGASKATGSTIAKVKESTQISTEVPNISVKKKHSPSQFTTGRKGSFTIKVNNKGGQLEKGVLTVVDHMPPGISVKRGGFRASLWSCEGGAVSKTGQVVTCSYNKNLNKNRGATLRLNVKVAPKGEFPKGLKEVENCASASVHGGGGVKVCDKVKVKHEAPRNLLDLPININIGIGGGSPAPKGSAPKTPGVL